MTSKEIAQIEVQNVQISFEEIRNLVGRLLTYVDATYTDKEQRSAHKSLVKKVVYDWGFDLYKDQYPDEDFPRGYPTDHIE